MRPDRKGERERERFNPKLHEKSIDSARFHQRCQDPEGYSF